MSREAFFLIKEETFYLEHENSLLPIHFMNYYIAIFKRIYMDLKRGGYMQASCILYIRVNISLSHHIYFYPLLRYFAF